MIEEKVAAGGMVRTLLTSLKEDSPGVLRFTSATGYYVTEIYWRKAYGKTVTAIQILNGRPSNGSRLSWIDQRVQFEGRSDDGWMNSSGVGMGTWWLLDQEPVDAVEDTLEVRLHGTLVTLEVAVVLTSS